MVELARLDRMLVFLRIVVDEKREIATLNTRSGFPRLMSRHSMAHQGLFPRSFVNHCGLVAVTFLVNTCRGD